MQSLHNKVVVITGAGSGIGRALAIQAAAQGAHLGLSDRDGDAAEETWKLCTGNKGRSGFALACDVRQDCDLRKIAEAAEALGGADVLINNAGVSLSAFAGETPREDFEALMDINFWGVVRGTEAFLPQLKLQAEAHIVNISSLFGLIGVPSQSAYNASKFAVRGYSESLRQELRKTSVRVSVVHPGGVRTNICKSGKHYKDSNGKPTSTEETSALFERLAKLSAEQAAAKIWHGVLRGTSRILVGSDAKWLDRVQRIFPASYDRLYDFAHFLDR
jgi:short-subunit dehydrogenase